MTNWIDLNYRIRLSKTSDKIIRIGIIGKYIELHDAYKSLIEAIHHAGVFHNCKVELVWINCRNINCNIDCNDDEQDLDDFDCLDGYIVPGGFGSTGTEEMIDLIKRARENSKPLLGICLGMQLICVEYARNVCHLPNCGSAEFGDYENEVVKIMIEDIRLGGTMRLGSHKVLLKTRSMVSEVYGSTKEVGERHRHRYDVDPKYIPVLENAGLTISGISEDNGLVEVVELSDSPFYVGCQFHPEYKSRPMKPHPLFLQLIKVCNQK